MELLDLLLNRTDPVTTLLLLVFLFRQRRAAQLVTRHLVDHHEHTPESAAAFVAGPSK